KNMTKWDNLAPNFFRGNLGKTTGAAKRAKLTVNKTSLLSYREARFAHNTDRSSTSKPKYREDCLNEVQFISRGNMQSLNDRDKNLIALLPIVDKRRCRYGFYCCMVDGCYNFHVSRRTDVLSGNTKGCGCGRVKHGLYRHPIHNSYKAMIARCYNTKHERYKDYGGRGVVVCDRWLVSFDNFVSDMLPTWFNGARLDKDSKQFGNKVYCPDLCTWVTPKQNNQHRRKRNIKIGAKIGAGISVM
ncbi:MAG: hypothetical protein ACRC2R_21895, partial [Xenococcaceae cyanobacterium]